MRTACPEFQNHKDSLHKQGAVSSDVLLELLCGFFSFYVLCVVVVFYCITR